MICFQINRQGIQPCLLKWVDIFYKWKQITISNIKCFYNYTNVDQYFFYQIEYTILLILSKSKLIKMYSRGCGTKSSWRECEHVCDWITWLYTQPIGDVFSQIPRKYGILNVVHRHSLQQQDHKCVIKYLWISQWIIYHRIYI